VLFTDIKGFTPFAEQTAPAKLAEVLGRYLQVMATVIQNEKGTIDKYIGDAVMAFWNAPEPVADHSVLACCAVLRCRSELRTLYDSPEWKGMPPFETRFGLHCSLASVRHFGAPNRFNYTAIGDGIKLASRLEALNSRYGTTIITSESIYSSAQERFGFRLLDRVAVKAKVQGIAIYELLAERTQDNLRSPYILRYEHAFNAYQRRDFQTVLDLLLDAESQDQPSRVFADRCRYLIKHSPPPDWNGTYVFASK
jgi:adenylate cyclase